MATRSEQELVARMRATGAVGARREIERLPPPLRRLRRELDGTNKSGAKARGSLRLFTTGLRPMVSLATSAGAALGVLGLTGAARMAITSASDLSEEINKTNVVFRGSEREVLSWSKSSAQGFGQSRQQALEAANIFGNMLVPLGFARKRAADMSKQMVMLAGDMASFNNADPSEVLEAFRSGLAGEVEPLRKYGVFINDARLRQEAANKGLYDGTGVLSNHARAVATYALILRDTKDAQGDFARTSGGLANQQRILRAELTDLAAELGKYLLPLVRDGTHALVLFIQQFRAGTGTGGDFRVALLGVAHVLGALAVFLWDNRDAVMTLTAAVLAGYAAWKAYMIVAKVVRITSAAIAVLKGLRAATLATTAAQLGLNAALFANPIGLIVAGVAALSAAFVVAYMKVGWFRDAVDSVWSFIKDHWPLLLGILTGPIGAAIGFIIEHFETVRRTVVSVLNWLIRRYNSVAGPLPGIDPINEIATFGPEIRGGGQRIRPLRGRQRRFARRLFAPSPLFAGASGVGGGGGMLESHTTIDLDGRTAARAVTRQAVKKKATS